MRLMDRLVRQHGLADDVADGEDVRHVGAHLDVHVDEATLRHGHAGFLGGDLLAVGGAAHGLQHQVVGLRRGSGATLLGWCKRDLDAFGRGLGAHGLGLEHDVVEALGVHLLPDLDEVAVGTLHQAVEHFDHVQARAQRAVDGAHLQADDAAAQDQHALGYLFQGQLSVLITRSILRQLGGEPGAAADITHRIAEGDLTVHIPLKPNDTTSLLHAIRSMRDSFSGIVGQVRSGSEGVATASAEIAQGNHDLSARTEQQASALEQTAASMEELGSTVKQNADSARQANQLAQSASTVAVKGGEVVGQVVETMKGINEASRRISDIISVIDGIAFQTNILALNAAVEAARAGEQGRGFAVVASEVRALAGRSAEAAKEIKTLIGASVDRVEHGTTLVDQAGATMNEVVSAIKRVTDIMGEISAASHEQSLGVAQVGEAVGHMDQTTQQNAALVEQMAAAASGLKSQAQDLVQVVAVFKLGSR
jgi:methyl-accepting chemotaxis protein